MDDGLIHQAQPIAQGTIRRPGQRLDGIHLKLNRLMMEDLFHLAPDLLGGQSLQIELQAAGQNRDRNFLRVGGRQQKLYMGGRLLQRFQQRIEAVRGEHVDFVDQVNLIAAPGWGIHDVVQQVAGILDLGAGSRVHFNQVNEAPLIQLATTQAFTARLGPLTSFAIHGLGQNTGDRGLPDSAGTGEEISVM